LKFEEVRADVLKVKPERESQRIQSKSKGRMTDQKLPKKK